MGKKRSAPVIPPAASAQRAAQTQDSPPNLPAKEAASSEVTSGQVKADDARVIHLQRELEETKASLQSTIEELQTTNEELKSANEEVLASNEALQDTNEQLKAVQEMLQSTNEVLEKRNRELTRLSNDLGNLLSSIHIPIVMVGNDLRIRHFTPTARKILKVIPTDVGRPIRDLQLQINVPDLEPLIVDVIDSAHIKELEVQDQEGHWHSMQIRPYKTQENQIDGAVIAWIDIDTIKRTKVRYRRLFETAFEGVREGIIFLDADTGEVLDVNPCLTELLGYAGGELVGRKLWEAAPFSNLEAVRFAFRELQEKDHTWIEDLSLETKGKQRVAVELVGHVCLLGSAKVIRCVLRDVTERKRAEAERAQLLAREQAARKEAEAANRAKDEFLATLSHELRTPLTAMLGWARLLRMGKLDKDAAAHAIGAIERNARSQAQLIEDLLDVSRIITGKLRLDARPIELVSVVVAAMDAVRPAADAKDIRLESVLDPEVGLVYGDPDRLQQVVWNLLSNAVKFTPLGGRIEVRLDRTDSQVQIKVSDTGQGISAEFLPYVFDRFRQADSTTTRPHPGLGLGLAIVRHLMELHGGTVHAESLGEGQGATFTVRLPRAAARRKATDSGQMPAVIAAHLPVDNPPALEGVRVLVVDDDMETRAILTMMLETCGVKVTAVASAREALEALERWKPDVLVSDIGMPGEDGYDLIRKVRALKSEHGGGIPAVALMAYARVEDRQHAISAGYQMHVPKPVEPTELIAVIATLVERTGTT